MTGMSRASGLSNSREPDTLERPMASFTAAITVWNSSWSSSNLISALVGWMFTSTVAGSTSR